MLSACRLCPHRCGVNRLRGDTGRCGAGPLPVVYRYDPHHGEEPPISGWKGSGAVFFSGCPLHCVYCQNHRWSQARPLRGQTYTIDELSNLFLELERLGCHNVNLVTPEPWVPHIVCAARAARTAGLSIPLVYNTSGFVTQETLSLLADTVDVYLTDIRYETTQQAFNLSSSGAYFHACREAARIMWHQVGTLILDHSGIATRGLLVRHLVLPGAIAATQRCLSFIAKELSSTVHVSLLTQYEPVYKAVNHQQIGHRITSSEYRSAMLSLKEMGLWFGWKQRLCAPEQELLGIAMKPNHRHGVQLDKAAERDVARIVRREQNISS